MRRTALLAFAVFLYAGSAHAQIVLPNAFDVADLSLSLSPQYPAPRESVRITAYSTLLDLDAAEVVWYVDGAERARNTTSITVQAGKLGSETQIEIVASDGGASASAMAFVRPTEIDLLWESDSYVPPFFRGRALPSAGTQVRLQAIARLARPDGSLVPSADTIYTWKRNDTVLKSVSGRGKARAVIDSPPLFGVDQISVEARSTDGTLIARKVLRLPSVEPILALYREHPLFGVLYHEALGTQTNLAETQTTFVAVPYFADAAAAGESSLDYAWKVNGQQIPVDPKLRNKITIDASNSSGLARIDLDLSSFRNLFLSAAGLWGVSLRGGEAGTFNDPFGGSE
ncbi:MAG: hypothetical protein HYS26_00515 [Candidatus Kaiserbacteria bacterium]|nr:MAG: hypothetical protein HYS26_00515 [Candidatus Kaiserbacteria bacterium]